MAQKPGNGGHGLEAYDPDTGRYIATDKGADGLEKYHAGAFFSVNDIREMITNGYYGDYLKNSFENGDDDEQSAIIGYIQTRLDQYYTKNKKEKKDFKSLSEEEFEEYGRQCAEATTREDRNYFYNNYVGTGDYAFEFNKMLRTGEQKYLQKIGMSITEFNNQVAAFDRLANSFKAPKDFQAFRFDQTGPIVSWFGKTGVLNGLPTYKNEYGYMQLDQRNIDLNDLAQRLSRLVGGVVPKDGAYSSFSCVDSQSHMIKNPDKIIGIKYNIPEGKNCFISQYEYESEGFFPRDTQFVIQDVKVENIGGTERVVLYYGVK